jgi:hypothetical protein
MTLVAMTLPDDPAELAGWLERHLAGLDLARLVAELSAVHGTPASPASSVRDLLGQHLDEVVRSGLGGLPSEMLRQLLRQPALLFELQEIVLAADSPHWDRLAGGELAAMVDEGWNRLERTLPREPVILRPRPRHWQRWVVGVVAAAAVVLIAVLSYPVLAPLFRSGEQPSAVAWGWARPGALPSDLPPAEYLRELADEADEWFKQRPEDTAALAKRIDQMRQGCRTLLEADHPPLSVEDRAWLRERCRAWQGKFDDAFAAVEAGRDPAAVQAEVDATVNRIAEVLRERAARAAG